MLSPEVNNLLQDYRESYRWVNESRETWNRAQDAVRSKIEQHERAAEVMRTQGLAGEKQGDEVAPEPIAPLTKETKPD